MDTRQRSLGEWLQEAPFSLGMSSGFFGFFAHAGLVCALEEAGLWPARLSGSSAGALVAACWAAGLPGRSLAAELVVLRRDDFWDPWPGPGLLRGRLFRSLLTDLLPVERFADCRWPLALSVFDVLSRKTRVVRSGPLAPAVHASCALPLLFQPVWLGFRPCLDGGISDRHGLAGMPDGGRLLYHHIASRSPWRRPDSPALKLPSRSDTVSLVIEDLPRAGPFNLSAGRHAYLHALDAARRSLDLPLSFSLTVSSIGG